MAQFLTSERFGSGSDGVLTQGTATDSTPNTTASGTTGTTALTVGSATGFANGNIVLIHQSRNGGSGAGAWELNVISSGGSTTSWTMKYALSNTYATTAQVYLLKQYTNVTISGSNTFTSTAWGGTTGGIVAFLANGTVSVAGTISLNAKGYRGAGSRGQGEGTVGAGDGPSSSANGNGGGGDYGDWAGGGSGGNGTAGQNGEIYLGGATVQQGGASVGNAALTTATFGGGSGCGTSDGGGGNGGGFLLIIAKNITITGGVTLTGGNGSTATGQHAGAGGGAGGSALFKGSTIVLGSTLVTAAGGTGASSTAGGVGRIHADYGTSVSGTTSPTLDSSSDRNLSDGFFGGII